jgi:hypothetical protein
MAEMDLACARTYKQDGAFIGPIAQRVHDLRVEIAAIR